MVDDAINIEVEPSMEMDSSTLQSIKGLVQHFGSVAFRKRLPVVRATATTADAVVALRRGDKAAGVQPVAVFEGRVVDTAALEAALDQQVTLTSSRTLTARAPAPQSFSIYTPPKAAIPIASSSKEAGAGLVRQPSSSKLRTWDELEN